MICPNPYSRSADTPPRYCQETMRGCTEAASVRASSGSSWTSGSWPVQLPHFHAGLQGPQLSQLADHPLADLVDDLGNVGRLHNGHRAAIGAVAGRRPFARSTQERNHALGQEFVKLLARPLRCEYSRRHRDASPCRRLPPATVGLGSKPQGILLSLSSNGRTSPGKDRGLPTKRIAAHGACEAART